MRRNLKFLGIGALMLGVIVLVAILSPSQSSPRSARSRPDPPAACTDLQCLGDKYTIRAGSYCAPHVEKLVSYSHRWTDGILESKFPAFQWSDKGTGVIRYIGSRIEFQNRYGAWVRYAYWCDFDTRSGVPVKVGALPLDEAR